MRGRETLRNASATRHFQRWMPGNAKRVKENIKNGEEKGNEEEDEI